MKNNTITEISLDDFLKLNLVGYKREWVNCGEYKKLEWVEHNLNDLVLDAMNDTDWNKRQTVVVAIHKNWIKAKTGEYDYESDFYYYDKWLNKSGAATYIIGADIEKLYKGAKKWYITEDYFDIPYAETEAIYFISKKVKKTLDKSLEKD